MNASRQRLVALGILAAVLGLVWLLVIDPIAGAFAAQSDDIAEAHRLLTAYAQRIAMRPLLEAQLASLKQHESTSAGLIGGGSAELAAANIQNTVKALIESESGQVTSAQNLQPVTADGFQRVEIQYDVTLPMARLKNLTYKLETAMPFLFLDGIDLRAPENWQNAGIALDPPPIQVRWTVSAYRWTGAP